jgi:hypothetical protein
MMRASYWLVVIGFVLGAVGFFIGILLDNRPVGIRLFFVGFILALVGIVISNLTMPFPESFKRNAHGLRIGTIGFCITSAGIVLSEFVTGTETVSTMILFIGVAVMIWGIVLIIGNVGKYSKRGPSDNAE